MADTTLKNIAKVIRSKNAGPFEITFDIIFDTKEQYERVKRSDALTREKMAKLYGVEDKDVQVCMFFDPAMAFKLTLRRNWGQGTVGERDTFGAQQHAPLLEIQIPK